MNRRAVVAEAQRTAAEPRGCKGLVWKRHWHWSHLSSDGRGSEGRFPDAPPQGASLWLAPCPRCMRQAPRKRSGPVAHFMGYYSTPVRILQWGVGGVLPGRMVLLWPASSFGGGSALAYAVVPPAHPPTFWGTGGLAVPPAGAAPPAPCAASVASLRWRIGTLPSLPPGTGTGTVFDCMLLSFSAEFRGFRHGSVVYPSLAVA